MADVGECTVLSELQRYIGEVISVLQEGGEQAIDLTHFRLHYLCNVVARYIDELHFGAEVLCLVQTARDIVCQQQSNHPVFYEVPVYSSGQCRRPHCLITQEQIEFFLDQNSTPSEIASLIGVSEISCVHVFYYCLSTNKQ